MEQKHGKSNLPCFTVGAIKKGLLSLQIIIVLK